MNIKLTINKDKISELFYNIAYIAFLVISIINTSMFAKYTARYSSLIYLFCLICIVMKTLLYSKYTKRQIIAYFVAIILTGIATFSADMAFLGVSIILIVSADGIDQNSLFSNTIFITFVLCVIVVECSRLGIIEDYIYNLDGRVRHTLGFRYTLFLPTYLFNISAIYVYLKKDKISVFSTIIIGIINYLLYTRSISRLTFFSTVGVLMFSLFHKWNAAKKNSKLSYFMYKLISSLSVPIYLVCSIFSIYMIINYDGSVWWQQKLNYYLGNRLVISQRSLYMYSFSLFGNPSIRWAGQGLTTAGEKPTGIITSVDNLYFNLLQRYGVVFFIIIILLLTIMMYKCYKSEDSILLFILFVLAIHGVIDDLIQSLNYNSFLFMMYSLVFSKKKTNNSVLFDINKRKSKMF